MTDHHVVGIYLQVKFQDSGYFEGVKVQDLVWDSQIFAAYCWQTTSVVVVGKMAASLAKSVPNIRSVATLSGTPTRSDRLSSCATSSRSSVFLGSSLPKRDLFYYGFIRRAELFHVLQCSAQCKSRNRLKISSRKFSLCVAGGWIWNLSFVLDRCSFLVEPEFLSCEVREMVGSLT